MTKLRKSTNMNIRDTKVRKIKSIILSTSAVPTKPGYAIWKNTNLNIKNNTKSADGER